MADELIERLRGERVHFLADIDIRLEAADRIAALEAKVAAADRLADAAKALGAMPEGYCFCSSNRIGDESKDHEPECRDLRAAIARAERTGGE